MEMLVGLKRRRTMGSPRAVSKRSRARKCAGQRVAGAGQRADESSRRPGSQARAAPSAARRTTAADVDRRSFGPGAPHGAEWGADAPARGAFAGLDDLLGAAWQWQDDGRPAYRRFP